MSTVLAPWPVCPPPHKGESLHSWFERVAAFYGLTAHRMLSSVSRGLPKPKRWSDAFKVGIALAGNRKVARRLIALGGLSPLLLRPAISITSWKRHQLQRDPSLAAALGYHHAKHPQGERFYIEYALLELPGAIENALARFETVRSWSLAEDLTPIEIADGCKLLGRNR